MPTALLSLAEFSGFSFQRLILGPDPGPLLSILYIVALIVIFFLPLVSIIGIIGIWAERKVSGHIQARLGPNRVGPFGLLQSVADGIKLILKEDLIPGAADKLLFRIAPYVAFAPVFAAFIALPFGPETTVEPTLNVAVFYILAVLSVEAMGVILAGWGSNNKWAVYGAMREACQMVSYEIPMGLSIIVAVMAAGTMNMWQMSLQQGGGVHTWLMFANPFVFLAFFMYFVASLAANKRAPFDLPESESELVAGFHTEYSGMRWAFFFFAEYAAMFVVAGIQVALFLGGWHDPFGLIGYYHQVFLANPDQHVVGLIVLNVIAVSIFILKASILVYVQIWIRWTLPRPRIDQVLYACVKVLLPAACILLLGAALWQLFIPARAGVPWADFSPLNWSEMTQPARDAAGRLVAEGSPVAVISQIVLAAVGVGLLAAMLGWIGYAIVTGRTAKLRLTDPEPIGEEVTAS